MFCYGPLVSELGGPECMVPPNPVIGRGAVPPGSAADDHNGCFPLPEAFVFVDVLLCRLNT